MKYIFGTKGYKEVASKQPANGFTSVAATSPATVKNTQSEQQLSVAAEPDYDKDFKWERYVRYTQPLPHYGATPLSYMSTKTNVTKAARRQVQAKMSANPEEYAPLLYRK